MPKLILSITIPEYARLETLANKTIQVFKILCYTEYLLVMTKYWVTIINKTFPQSTRNHVQRKLVFMGDMTIFLQPSFRQSWS